MAEDPQAKPASEAEIIWLRGAVALEVDERPRAGDCNRDAVYDSDQEGSRSVRLHSPGAGLHRDRQPQEALDSVCGPVELTVNLSTMKGVTYAHHYISYVNFKANRR